MRICVYCSSAPEIDPKFQDFAYEVGAQIAAAGHDLVWGGGVVSMMGAVARGAREHGGKTFGVIPKRLLNIEFADRESTELFETSDMRTRKAKMAELADAFIVLPGGIGTLEELFETWVGRYLGFHAKPIAICDLDKSFASLHQALADLTKLKFMKSGQEELIFWGDDVESCLKYFADYNGA
jgi:uncharacterized protein (TIGR00730 family)